MHPNFIQNVYTDDMYLNTLNRPNTRRSIDDEYSYEKPSKTFKPESSSSTGFTRRKSDPESRRRRQAWYDNKYIENKLEEVNKKFKKSDYLLLDDLMTYEEAMDKCHEQVWLTDWRHHFVTILSSFLSPKPNKGNYKLALTTNMDELLFVHHYVLKEEKVKFWLQLREPGVTPCDTKCWTYRFSSYDKFNYHIKSRDWKRHPNFRYLNCQKQAAALCKRTKPVCDHPCVTGDHKCPKGAQCVAKGHWVQLVIGRTGIATFGGSF